MKKLNYFQSNLKGFLKTLSESDRINCSFLKLCNKLEYFNAYGFHFVEVKLACIRRNVIVTFKIQKSIYECYEL